MTERHTAPHRSFAEFFAAEIAPGLPALETQRRDRRRNAYTRLLVAAFVVVVTALIVGMAWHALAGGRSEEHTSELQSLMRISYAVFCLKTKNKTKRQQTRK